MSGRLFAALEEFWQGNIPGLSHHEELCKEAMILQFGLPPNRIDLINQIDGVAFHEAWLARADAIADIEDERVTIHFIGLDHLIRNKETAGRPKDLADLEYLQQARDS